MSTEKNPKKLAAKNARKAQKEMLAYMEKHKLDPNKDWTKDPKHGKKIQAWVDIVNLGNKKARELSEEKGKEKAEAKKTKKPEVNPKKETIKAQPNAYNYPKIDGKDMTPDQKKKYRSKMRTLLKTLPKDKAEAEAIKLMSASSTKKAKPEKVKESPEPKKETKKDKKAKKEAKSPEPKKEVEKEVKKNKKDKAKKKKAKVEEED